MHGCFSFELEGKDAPRSPGELFSAQSGSILAPPENSQLQNEPTFMNKSTEEETTSPSSAIGVTLDNSVEGSDSAENQSKDTTGSTHVPVENSIEETKAILMTCSRSDDNAENPSDPDREQRPAPKFSWTSLE